MGSRCLCSASHERSVHSPVSWLDGKLAESASQAILDAASNLFARHGVAAVEMSAIAAEAGCSRATLYRYFESRDALHLAYIHREAAKISGRIADRIAGTEEPAAQLAAAMHEAITAIRSEPALAAWFRPGEYIGGSLALQSQVIDAMVSAVLQQDRHQPVDERSTKLLVRMTVSLLTYPEHDTETETAAISNFTAALVAARATHDTPNNSFAQ